ncbi:MAG TPA: ChbG/HpnK family deacetylase [Alphaproteobacteria bacterium]|nr:ChbG/HpnK family deacetylase [Alphaproteobacteria bacterium]
MPDNVTPHRNGDSLPVGIVLCADDYGIAPGVGEAIRHLLSLGRISATSCMTGSAFWPEEARALKPYAERADIGLHITLTDQAPLAAMPHLAPQGRMPSIFRMIFLSHGRWLARPSIRSELKTEIARQFDRFQSEFGRPPAYLDGHQHVHQLPVVRDLVIELFRERLSRDGAYLRYCTERLGAILRRRYYAGESLGIAVLGRRFAQRARKAGIPGNRRFSGVHDFSGRIPYGVLFESFVANASAGTLVMCHPGIADGALAVADRVTSRRQEEYQYFLSNDFLESLKRHKVSISRFANK